MGTTLVWLVGRVRVAAPVLFVVGRLCFRCQQLHIKEEFATCKQGCRYHTDSIYWDSMQASQLHDKDKLCN
jgi:hypothetical protein